MFTITGITGQVGGSLGRTLLAEGAHVRAVVRDATKGRIWSEQGCEVAIAAMEDASALERAFAGAEGVFILLPPCFDPAPGFIESRRIIEAIRAALEAARPERVVCLSTIGAQATTENLLSQLSLLEQSLGQLSMPINFLRPAWFIENISWDIASARQTGVIPSFLQPLDRRIPMVGTVDVGHTAARLLRESWPGGHIANPRIVELEGPQRLSPDDLAAGLTRALGRPVAAECVPRERWETLFRAQGMRNPLPRMRMLDGFNEGWIDFQCECEPAKGLESLDRVIAAILERAVACP